MGAAQTVTIHPRRTSIGGVGKGNIGITGITEIGEIIDGKIPPHLLVVTTVEMVEEVVTIQEEVEEVGEVEDQEEIALVTQVTRVAEGIKTGGGGEALRDVLQAVAPEGTPEEVQILADAREEVPVPLHLHLHLPQGVLPAAGVAVTVGVMSIVMSIVMGAGDQ